MYKPSTKTKPKSTRGRKPGLGSEIASFFKPFKKENEINPKKFLDDRVKMFLRKHFLKSKRLKRKYYFLYLQYTFLCDQEKESLDSNKKASILRDVLARDYIVFDEVSQKFKAGIDFIKKLTEMLQIQYAGIDKDKESYYFHLLFDEIVEYIKKGVRNKKNLPKTLEANRENDIIDCENKNTILNCGNPTPLNDFDSIENDNITNDFIESLEEFNEDGKSFAPTSQILDSCYLFKDFIPEDTNVANTYLSPSQKNDNRENSERERKNPLLPKWRKLQANS